MEKTIYMYDMDNIDLLYMLNKFTNEHPSNLLYEYSFYAPNSIHSFIGHCHKEEFIQYAKDKFNVNIVFNEQS